MSNIKKLPKKGPLAELPERFLQLSIKYGEDSVEEMKKEPQKIMNMSHNKKLRFYDFIQSNKEDFWNIYSDKNAARKDPTLIQVLEEHVPEKKIGLINYIEIISLTGTTFNKENGLELLDNIKAEKENGIVKLKRDYNNQYDTYAIEVNTLSGKLLGYIPANKTIKVGDKEIPINQIVASNMENKLLVTTQIAEIQIKEKNTPIIQIIIGWEFKS